MNNNPPDTISRLDITCIYKRIYTHVAYNVPNKYLLYHCLDTLEKACDNKTHHNTRQLSSSTRELASTFFSKITWECGCQVTQDDSHPLLSKTYSELAKVTVAVAFYDNWSCDRQMHNYLQTQWLINASCWTLENKETLKRIQIKGPTSGLASSQEHLISTINRCDPDTQTLVSAILQMEFNWTMEAGIFMPQRESGTWYQNCLQYPRSKEASTITHWNPNWDNAELSRADIAETQGKMRSTWRYNSIVTTEIEKQPIVVDLDKKVQVGTNWCPLCPTKEEYKWAHEYKPGLYDQKRYEWPGEYNSLCH